MNIPANIYDVFMYPLEKMRLGRIRDNLIKYAEGEVLEIGTGTGINLKYLPFRNIRKYVGMDLKLKFLNMPEEAIYAAPIFKYEFAEGKVEKLPFEDNSFDTVVFTLVFCSVEHPRKGLREVKRVLKPGGRLIFIEHILPKHKLLKPIFHGLTPLWSKAAHNCHLNRETVSLIKKAGFNILSEEYFFKGAFVGGAAINE